VQASTVLMIARLSLMVSINCVVPLSGVSNGGEGDGISTDGSGS
jgi:hypothetical protein